MRFSLISCPVTVVKQQIILHSRLVQLYSAYIVIVSSLYSIFTFPGNKKIAYTINILDLYRQSESSIFYSFIKCLRCFAIQFFELENSNNMIAVTMMPLIILKGKTKVTIVFVNAEPVSVGTFKK